MDGVSVVSGEDDSAADGSGGGGGAGGEEVRRCNAPRAARPILGSQKVCVSPALLAVVGGGSGHNRKTKPHQRQQQQQQQQQLMLHQQQPHGGGKKQKKQQKWKANKYGRGGRGGGGTDRKDVVARGRKEAASGKGRQADDILSNSGNAVGEDAGSSTGAGGAVAMASSSENQNQTQQQTEQPGTVKGPSQATVQSNHTLQQSSHPAQQTSAAGSQQGHGGPQSSSSLSALPSQKSKHSKQQNLTPMGLRNKRLQSVSKYFLPDKRPRKDCIVPPTKFLLGGNISDPLNLNSLQNESENAVTPKSSPIPTPPHYKAKIEVIIPPNINDPLHLLDPVDSVEYEMQLCSPMKRKQRPRNKRKRKSRTTTERNVDGALPLAMDQLPPPAGVEPVESLSAGTGVEEAATAEEASFTGIGQKLAEAGADRFSMGVVDSFPFPEPGASHHQNQQHPLHQHQSTSVGGLLLQSSHYGTSVAASASSASGGVSAGTSGSSSSLGAVAASEQDREREKAMRNLKLDLENAGGRKRRTSESTNSTKNKVRRMDSMDKIVSPVIPQPGGWKRGHWPANAGGTGAAGSAGRNRTRTYSAASNTDEAHGEEGTSTERASSDAQLLESRHQSAETIDVAAGVQSGTLTATSGKASNSEPLATARGDKEDQQPTPAVEPTATVGSSVPRPMTALAASSRYHYGNYDRYYGYHSLNEFIDVRLKVFLRNPYLFRDKDVLDIGCNVGLMTIAVARMLHTKTTTGIDVDGKLIAKARKNLANYVRLPKKVPIAMGRRGNGVTASATVTSERQLKECASKMKDAVAQAAPEATGGRENDVSTESQLQLLVGTEEPGKDSQSIPASQTLDVVGGSTPLNSTDSHPIAMNAESRSGEEDATKTPDETLQPVGQYEQLLGDPDASSAMELKQSELVHKARQKHRRKQFGAGKRHGKHHQQHHHAQHHLRHASGRGKAEYAHYFPISFPLTMGNLSGKEYQMDIGKPEHKFPHNVRFKTMNYVVKDESFINYDTQQYDLILCLSVTKWIHLNYGDTGLKIAFKRMFNHLRPGGKLILEAQNWASYKKKKKLTETIFENYKNIEFFPCRFHDYLLSPEVGFSHSYALGIPRHLSKGFRRPIQLYIKGDFTPSQAKWSDTYHPGTPYENHRGIYTDIVTSSQTAANCIWGAMTPYAPSYSYRQPSTPSHVAGGSGGGGSGSGGGGGSGGFSCTSPYYNPRQTDSYLPSYDNIGANHRPGSYCFASPLYSTTWSPPSDMLATSGGGGGSYRRSASNTPNSASIRSTDNDEHYYAGAAGSGSQRRNHVYPPIDVFPPLLGYDNMRPGGSFRSGGGGGGGGGGGAMTDSDSEPSCNSASQTPTRQQQFLNDDQSNSPSGHSQPDK